MRRRVKVTLTVIIGGPETEIKVIGWTNSELVGESWKVGASDLECGNGHSV
jgi:hypothetical protein